MFNAGIISVGFPAAPSGDPFFANVRSLVHLDTNFSDVIGNTWSAASGTPTIDATTFRWGGGSSRHTADRITTTPNAAFQIGSSQDFTLEAWVYPTQATADNYYTVLHLWSPTGGLSLEVDLRNRYLHFTLGAGGDIQGGTQMTLNTWNHIAICRQGSSVRGFLNGAQTSSVSVSSAILFNRLSIGGFYPAAGGAQFYRGYVDDVRYTVGTARYTGGFTAPTAAFPDSV